MHILKPLPYAPDALEPYIDARTLLLHYGKHHASYVKELNKALENFPELQSNKVEDLVRNIDSIPEAIRETVRHNAGGHLNHTMLWEVMTPGGPSKPVGGLDDAIKRTFGSYADFKLRFAQLGADHFASGWVWLVKDATGELEIMTTSGHDNPLTFGKLPLLVNDLWEHAYYLIYQNRRPEYLKAFWPVVNWNMVAQRFELGQPAPSEFAVM